MGLHPRRLVIGRILALFLFIYLFLFFFLRGGGEGVMFGGGDLYQFRGTYSRNFKARLRYISQFEYISQGFIMLLGITPLVCANPQSWPKMTREP